MPDWSNEAAVVLVVDDDSDVREGLAALFQSIGLHCETYASAGDFLQSPLPDRVSCLILDVRLPGQSGLDFQTEMARAQINLPTTFIAGHGNISITKKAMKAGA